VCSSCVKKFHFSCLNLNRLLNVGLSVNVGVILISTRTQFVFFVTQFQDASFGL